MGGVSQFVRGFGNFYSSIANIAIQGTGIWALQRAYESIYNNTKTREKRKYEAMYNAAYKHINDKFKLNLKSPQELEWIASEAAGIKAEQTKSKFHKFVSVIEKKPFMLILVVVAAVSTIYSGGALAGAWGSIYAGTAAQITAGVLGAVGTLAGMGATLYGFHQAHLAQAAALEAQSKSAELAGLKRSQKIAASKKQITHLIIYGGYAMYANGELFKYQNAGSDSFSPSLAYDNAKGIYGEVQNEEVDEYIQKRRGKILAAGIDFADDLLGLEMPLKNFNLPSKAILDSLESRYKADIKRISDGFKELEKNNYTLGGSKQHIYDRVFKEQIEPIKQAMISEDFLAKNKAYNQGILRDFFPLHKKNFKEKKRDEYALFKAYANFDYKGFLDNAENSLEEKALRYIQRIQDLLIALTDLDDETFGKFVPRTKRTIIRPAELRYAEVFYKGFTLRNQKGARAFFDMQLDPKKIPADNDKDKFKNLGFFDIFDGFYSNEKLKNYTGAQYITMYDIFKTYLCEVDINAAYMRFDEGQANDYVETRQTTFKMNGRFGCFLFEADTNGVKELYGFWIKKEHYEVLKEPIYTIKEFENFDFENFRLFDDEVLEVYNEN